MHEWSETTLMPLLNSLELEGASEGVTFQAHYQPHVDRTQTAEIIGMDLALASLPLPIGFIYLLLYTNSVFLAGVGTLLTAVA